MCKICERGITFRPKDLVVRKSRDKAGDCDYTEYWYYGLQLGNVLTVSSEYGTIHLWATVQVKWGTKEDGEMEFEWCWPSDFVARIRDGKYETIAELWENPS